MSLKTFVKDPNATLDYILKWAPWLRGDFIDTSSWIVPAGLTLENEDQTSTTTTAWLSGGTVGESYEVVNRITTIGGRTEDRTLTIKIRER